MKSKLIIFLFLVVFIANSQTKSEIDNFLNIVKLEIKNYKIGKIEEHFEDGYFLTLSESEYFDSNMKIGITTIFQRTYGKSQNEFKQIIFDFFEQHKRLKIQKNEIKTRESDFNYMKSFLKIKIYNESDKDLYAKSGSIIRPFINSLITVVVLDLPDGIGSINRGLLKDWKKTEAEIFEYALDNTKKYLKLKFINSGTLPTGEEIYMLANDLELFTTSSILNINDAKIPMGKYGTIISVPNNITIAASPLDVKEKIEANGLNFYNLTNYLYKSVETKPLSNKIFWFDGNNFYEILYLEKLNKLAFPDEMKKFTQNK